MHDLTQTTRLASHDLFRVTRLGCGSVSLHMGALTLRIDPDALEPLARTLSEASFNLSRLNEADRDTQDASSRSLGWPLQDTDNTFH